MENEYYTDDFEQLLKEKANQFRMYPSKRVWHSIYNNLHPGRRWPSIVMSLLLVSSLIIIGYLNTGENNLAKRINTSYTETPGKSENTSYVNVNETQPASIVKIKESGGVYTNAFDDVLNNETDFYTYTVVRNNRPEGFFNTTKAGSETISYEVTKNNDKGLVQRMDDYIKNNQLFADVSLVAGKKNKPSSTKSKTQDAVVNEKQVESEIDNTEAIALTDNINTQNDADKLKPVEQPTEQNVKPEYNSNKTLTPEDKAWIEAFALQNKKRHNKLKGRLAFQFYVTPAVNYRKLTTKSKGSTAPMVTGDLNNAISQKPGFGIETGISLHYSFAKNLLVKAGLQFNYTNFNIDADQSYHPVITTILLNDPVTGYSYLSPRSSSTFNPVSSAPLKPITLHNRTYQISLPVGFAYKLSSKEKVDWYAGATLQPTYIFGGNAHIVSADLKNYVSYPSSISSWNLNLGFETYMNFKLGSYNLQVGPQVRTQVFSTYKRNVALIEKPYAVGLKLGLTKGF
ncbi:MAG: hypothetical protein KF825_07955 [Ferruginibacter sp.]|nr:hypothetical protein [Ferruginibacter sp.]